MIVLITSVLERCEGHRPFACTIVTVSTQPSVAHGPQSLESSISPYLRWRWPACSIRELSRRKPIATWIDPHCSRACITEFTLRRCRGTQTQRLAQYDTSAAARRALGSVLSRPRHETGRHPRKHRSPHPGKSPSGARDASAAAGTCIGIGSMRQRVAAKAGAGDRRSGGAVSRWPHLSAFVKMSWNSGCK